MPYKVAEPVKTSIFLPTQKASTVGGFVNTLSSLLRLLEELEDHDDVQDVFSNMNASDEAMAAAMDE